MSTVSIVEDGNEQVIETTDAHPFWVVTDEPDLERTARSVVNENGVWLYHENIAPTENGFWVEAKDLRVGDVFLGANGELTTLTNIVRVEQSGGIDVFNFTVAGNHNYFILAKEYGLGQTSVLVHNACKQVASANLKRLGLEGVDLHGKSYNSGRKSLENNGFHLSEITKTGRKTFENPRTGTKVHFDSGKALFPGQKKRIRSSKSVFSIFTFLPM